MIHHRKSPRRSSYDYTSPWWYFVTIVTKDRERYFGEIVDGRMVYSEVGKICDEQLHVMIAKRPSVDLHEYIVMSNHVHILLTVHESNCRDTDLSCPINLYMDDASDRPYTNQSLGSIVGWWKSAVTRYCNKKWLPFARQSRYHDHIIRNQNEYHRIKHYIQNNPAQRNDDRYWK